MMMYYLRARDLGRIRVSPMQHGWAEFLDPWYKMQELHGKNPFEAAR